MLIRLLEPETFDRRRASALDKLEMVILHRIGLGRLDNGEAVPLEHARDVLADAAVARRRTRRRPAAAPVFDDFEFFARPQRSGERRDELARQVPITANNTQTSRRHFRFARFFANLHQAPCGMTS